MSKAVFFSKRARKQPRKLSGWVPLVLGFIIGIIN